MILVDLDRLHETETETLSFIETRIILEKERRRIDRETYLDENGPVRTDKREH